MGTHPSPSPSSASPTRWLPGLLAAAALVVGIAVAPTAGLEGSAFDSLLRAAERAPANALAVVALDSPDQATPVARAGLIRRLSAAAPALIVDLSPAAPPPPLDALQRLALEHGRAVSEWIQSDPDAPLARMGTLVHELRLSLDPEAELAAAISAAGNVVVPAGHASLRTLGAAAAQGRFEHITDADGVARATSLETGAGAPPIGALARVLLERAQAMPPAPPALLRPYRSARHALDSTADLGSLSGKIVLVGATHAGGPLAPPVDRDAAPVFRLADEVSSLLERRWIEVPEWADAARLALLVLVGLYLGLALPRLTPRAGLAASAVLGMAIAVAYVATILLGGLWLPMVGALASLILGHPLILLVRRAAQPAVADAPAADPTVPLFERAAAQREAGELDAAFATLASCPASALKLERLYALAVDFERKRRFERAEAVLRAIATEQADFRDVQGRLERVARRLDAPGVPVLAERVETSSLPRLRRYRLDRAIGSGLHGGTVYIGREQDSGRELAIKVTPLAILAGAGTPAEAKQRFLRETEAAGRLVHPHIVALVDAGAEYDLVYVAMEIAPGASLERYTTPDSRLPLGETLAIVARVAEALDYAHRERIIHHAVKPANIIYDPATRMVKLTDFGIGRLKGAAHAVRAPADLAYCAPEQLGEARIDGRADLYALGVVLFEMACGRLPYSADTPGRMMIRIENESIPDIRALDPALPESLAQFLAKALAKRASERFATGAEFAEALAAVAVSRPVAVAA